MSFLKIKGVRKVFTKDRHQEVIALDGLSFVCNEGEFLCIVGPTGCGKTTLLRLIAGLEPPTEGKITMNGQIISGINKQATLVFQQYSLFPWRNVIDNIAFSLEVKSINKERRYLRARELIELVGLSGFERAFPYELSGGMQQRVAIVRALAYDPGLLLLDEPFGALDERTRHHLQEELLSIWERERKTILFVTHNIDEAVFLASRILVMRDRPGRIEEEIKVNLPRPRDRMSEEFIDLHIRIREILERILSECERRQDV
ncbi:MAG TPA: ABC transporter ATP-binding protein [bacterium (Candidatus Stahlbacteria)]|nr:ABC transporter ATP-binding protein [Candidatus Stahlbacteria bacterium]